LVTAPSPAAAGGLLGNNNAGTITSSYWDDQSSGFSTIGVGTGSSTGTTGLTTAQLKSGNMPSGFNPDLSDSPWVSPAGVYPYFGWQGALVPIEGTASNGAALGAAGVGVLWNGSLIASTTTLSNGTYGVEVPQNMTVGGVLTYLTSGGVANAFTDGTGPEHFLDMELGVGNLYIVNAASTTLSGLTNALATTIGSLTGANFLYTVSSGLLHLNSGANLYFGSYQSFTFDRPLSVPGSILFEDLQSVTIANSSPITAGSGDHIEILVGLQNNASAFVNNAGADALNVSGGGNWLVYSVNPANDITGGLVPAFLQYSASQGATPAQSGNGLLYSIAPIITPSLTGTVGKTYDGTTAAALSASNFAVSGAINGDTVTLTTPSSGTFETANVGANITISSAAVSVASATHDGLPVYGYGLSETPASGEIGIITPAMLTYTANTGSRTYGASNPALSGTVTGFVDGQTLSTATSGSATFTSAATATSNVGAYSIDGSGLTANNGNYVFVQADGNSSALTINPATLTYSANTGSRTYGAGNPALSGTVTGFVNGQTLATATSGSVTFTTAATAASNVGTYAIDGSGLTADHGNYVFAQAEGNSTALTINPATLTYTANPVSRPPGASNPVFSGTVTGFVDGQTLASATTGTALFTSAAGTTSAAGGYAIDGSGLTADHGNYVFTQASANASALTVTAAVMPPPPPTPTPTPTVLNFVIGNTSALQSSQPTFTAAYTGAAINGLDIASILSGLTFTITPAISGPGTYAITAAGTAPHGYTLNIAPATLTIVGSTSAILPSQAPLINPVLPELLPSAGGNDSTSLLPPLNSVGLFQVNVPAAGGNSGASLNVLGNQQQPLAQSGFFGTSDKKDTYSAGAKP
jgi:hypothetical protein